MKRKCLTLQRYEDHLIDILTEGNEIEQFYEESTKFEILYQETLTLINDFIKCTEHTTTHTHPIVESLVNNEEDVKDEDSSSSARFRYCRTGTSCKTTKTRNSQI